MVLLSGSVGSQMFLAGSDNICGFNGDNGAIGVGNESGVGEGSIRVSSSVGNGGNGGNTVSGEVSSLRGNSTVGVSYEGTSVVRVCSISMSIRVSSVIISVVSSPCTGVSVRVSSVGNGTLGGEVSSLSGDDLRGLGGCNGTTGVFNELNGGGSGHAGREENQ